MDWRALSQNQWFQLCGLVAVLATGALLYDLAAGRFGGQGHVTPPGGPTPGPVAANTTPTPAPTPFAKLRAKKQGQWIVDAAGASDADSRDLRAVAANAADGDTVTIRPGSYAGGFEVAHSVRFVGQGNVSIHATDRNTVLVSAPRTVFDHVTIEYNAADDRFFAVVAARNGQVVLDNCTLGSRGKFDVFAADNATLDAHNSRFQTQGNGCALKYVNNSHGRLERCEFSYNQWGVEAINSAQIEVAGCNFTKNGKPNGSGCIMAIQGGQAKATASFCNFTGNTATLLADESGTLVLNGCTFRDNGVTGEQGNSNGGLVRVQTGGKASVVNCTLESNKQGLTAFGGGSLQVTNTKITGTGIQTTNDTLKYFARAVYATDNGTTVLITSSTVADTLSDGVMAIAGASLTMIDSTVSNSAHNGLTVGYPNLAASHAELTRTRFPGNRVDGLYVCAACSVNAQDCEFSDNGADGVEIDGANSQGRFTNVTCRNNKDQGLWTESGAWLSASGCTLEGNSRGAQAGSTEAQGRASMELTNCTVRGNTVYGLGACQQSVLTFQGGYLGGQRQNISRDTGGTVRQLR